MEVYINIKEVYGNTLIYPVNDTASLLLRLTGKKTFSPHDLNTLKLLGYEIKEASKLNSIKLGV